MSAYGSPPGGTVSKGVGWLPEVLVDDQDATNVPAADRSLLLVLPIPGGTLGEERGVLRNAPSGLRKSCHGLRKCRMLPAQPYSSVEFKAAWCV